MYNGRVSAYPPPYAPPKQKNNTTLIIMIVLGIVGCGCLAIIGFGAFFGFKIFGQLKPLAGCAISFESVHKAMLTYTAENGGKLPKAETWQDDLRPYVAKELSQVKEAPFDIISADGNWGCSRQDNAPMTGMAFNSEFSGKPIAEAQSKNGVLLFEIEAARRNAAQPYKPLDPNKSEKFMGMRRGWMVVFANGRPDFVGGELGDKGSGRGFKID